MWITDEELNTFINALPNLDIGKSHNARWIDQKCTPDVLSIVADCIGEFVSHFEDNKEDQFFTSQDIWHSDYTKDNVSSVFQKPNVNSKDAIAEYNKFFMQPMELLSYSNVLKKEKRGNQNFYTVNNSNVLNYIAIREKNSLNFLIKYITKVLKDSKIYNVFHDFFKHQDKDHFNVLKDFYLNYIIENTPINGKTEVSRIFTKVLNPLSYALNLKGTYRGHISKNQITLDMLMYNRLNFRDIFSNKPKDQTRKGFIIKQGKRSTTTEAFRKYLVNKAKRLVREYNLNYNKGLSELQKDSNNEKASHVHHIFPDCDFPQISYYNENLICLNPNQHLNHAHPNGNTQRVDKDYQKLLIIAKKDTIYNDFKEKINFYDFDLFKEVLSIGLNEETFISIKKNDFSSLDMAILNFYLNS